MTNSVTIYLLAANSLAGNPPVITEIKLPPNFAWGKENGVTPQDFIVGQKIAVADDSPSMGICLFVGGSSECLTMTITTNYEKKVQTTTIEVAPNGTDSDATITHGPLMIEKTQGNSLTQQWNWAPKPN